MFRGITDISLDERGRMAMPTRYREKIRERSAGKLVITIARHDPCLSVYAERDWLAVEEELTELDRDDPENRRQQHMLIGFATDVELDGHGRVVIPQRLRDYAQLEKRVVVVGQPNLLELWNDQTWEANVSAWRDDANQSIGGLTGNTEAD